MSNHTLIAIPITPRWTATYIGSLWIEREDSRIHALRAIMVLKKKNAPTKVRIAFSKLVSHEALLLQDDTRFQKEFDFACFPSEHTYVQRIIFYDDLRRTEVDIWHDSTRYPNSQSLAELIYESTADDDVKLESLNDKRKQEAVGPLVRMGANIKRWLDSSFIR